MRKSRIRFLQKICTLQHVVMLGVMVLLIRLIVLPEAHNYFSNSFGQQQWIGHIALHNAPGLSHDLHGLPPEARKLGRTIVMTAGLTDILLTTAFWLMLVAHLAFRFHWQSKRVRVAYLLAGLACSTGLLYQAGLWQCFSLSPNSDLVVQTLPILAYLWLATGWGLAAALGILTGQRLWPALRGVNTH